MLQAGGRLAVTPSDDVVSPVRLPWLSTQRGAGRCGEAAGEVVSGVWWGEERWYREERESTFSSSSRW